MWAGFPQGQSIFVVIICFCAGLLFNCCFISSNEVDSDELFKGNTDEKLFAVLNR